MHLLLGFVRDWTYCQQLNNISVSSPYKKYSQKSVHTEIVALIVTWMLLTTFSPAENKAEPSSQLCASVSLPYFEHASTQTARSAEERLALMVGSPKSGPFSGGILLNPLISQFLFKMQLGDSDFLEAKEDLWRLATVQLQKAMWTNRK